MVVLDACAIIAYLRNEAGSDVVESALINEQCFAHAVNLCEVYKDCLSRGESTDVADSIIRDLLTAGLLTREDIDDEFWKSAAQTKVSVRQVSYFDCFALTLTERLGAVLYTSDHHELDQFANNNRFQITFIR